MKRIVLFFLILVLAGGVLTAGVLSLTGSINQAKAAGPGVDGVWARAGQADGTSAIYLVINNPLGPADRLVDVKCDASMMAELHKTETDASGNMKMVHQAEGVRVPVGEGVTFAPGGLHIMLMSLKRELKPGDRLPFTLVFEKAGSIAYEAPIREP